jgi:uncharacterized RDD family membrane protein YckC
MPELREHYEREDTEELLEIARKDLTEEARPILQEVLAKRGISLSQASAMREREVRAESAKSEVGKRLASIGARLAAFAIDTWGVGIILYVLLLPLQLVSSELHQVVFLILWWSYFFLRDSIPAQSLGKRLFGIRTVQHDSFQPCTWSRSLWRNFSHVLFVIDAVFALGQRRMRLGDMIAGTVVIRRTARRPATR